MPHQVTLTYFQIQSRSACQISDVQPKMGLLKDLFAHSKEEHINYTEYMNFADAFGQIEYWMEVDYMTERIHSSLAYLTPSEFEAVQVAC